jgi:glycosyltransferase involved in cell wall biosynthesis
MVRSLHILSVRSMSKQTIYVDVLVPVHNASATIEETVGSAMKQMIPLHLQAFYSTRRLNVAVCCFDDGSTDDSWCVLEALKVKYGNETTSLSSEFTSTLMIQSSKRSRGAAVARNRAAQMRDKKSDDHVLVWLDSDDTMHPHRIPEQVHALLQAEDGNRLLLGSQFDRDPPDSTWHYAQWANTLTEERLMMEQYREVTVLQPTWCMMRSRFEALGGYIETKTGQSFDANGILQLVHKDETEEKLRLAEDLRFIHAHLHADGLLRIVPKKLVVYRHRVGQSQSAQTPRKLLLQLRALAFEVNVLSNWERFVVWGAGRDGKDFLKALSKAARNKVVCMADVDHKKIEAGYYYNNEMGIQIPVVHFSLLAKDSKVRDELQEAYYTNVDSVQGRIKKCKPHCATTAPIEPPPRKKFKVCNAPGLILSQISELPVVVCVAMYRTNGVLERNVASIDRKEGHDLWHFS